ncbi:hypothetical protein, conserved [Leishmania tarentolae]|uniref:Uncharacterized protein n=1 Tax=Leishmania tarentolae TaxID=5689 RepID=A0A640KJ97_LEITA|nr:hypothetical protein, conserved [Leishmania tarentolae]
MADQTNSLVVWGSTGRRLQFSTQDLKMPERLRDHPHIHFYEKQWESVASFWFNRVLKETALQHLSVEAIVELIYEDISKRWERRRQEQNIYKKRKRLLQGTGTAGKPSECVLVTNLTTLKGYLASTEMDQKGLITEVVKRIEDVAKTKVESWHVLIDDASEEERSAKSARVEGVTDASGEHPDNAADASGDFDDGVAVVLRLSSKEKAATTIAHLHGSRFDGRRVLCRFWNEE